MNKSLHFEQAGEGYRIEFPISALITLEQKYGVGEAFEVIELRLMSAAATTVADCLDVGLRKAGEDGKCVLAKMPVDDWPFTPQDAVLPIMDGLALAWFGHDYAKTLETRHAANVQAELEMLKMSKEAGGAEDPLAGSQA